MWHIEHTGSECEKCEGNALKHESKNVGWGMMDRVEGIVEGQLHQKM